MTCVLVSRWQRKVEELKKEKNRKRWNAKEPPWDGSTYEYMPINTSKSCRIHPDLEEIHSGRNAVASWSGLGGKDSVGGF